MMNKLYFYCLALFVAPTFSAFGQTQPLAGREWVLFNRECGTSEMVPGSGECFRARTSGHQR